MFDGWLHLYHILNQNIIVQKEQDDNKMPIVQQHIKGVGNIYAPEIIIR